jgi:hypothetical protein
MGFSFHLKCITFSLLIVAKTLFSEPVIESERKNVIQNLNDPEFKIFLSKSLSRHPLGLFLGHVIVRAVDKANPSGQSKRFIIFNIKKIKVISIFKPISINRFIIGERSKISKLCFE